MDSQKYIIFDSGLSFSSVYLTESVAYLLGNIFSADESIFVRNERFWIAPTRYNSGYATREQIEQHFESVKKIASAAGAEILMAENIRHTSLDSGKFNRMPGFGTFVKSKTLNNLKEKMPELNQALSKSNISVQTAFIVGVFDGRGSIDFNKKTNGIRYIVLDCPTSSIGDFLCQQLTRMGFDYNYNIARERLEGGEPRKPQLRIRDSEKYMKQFGFISPKKLELANISLSNNCTVTVESHDEILPGLKMIIKTR